MIKMNKKQFLKRYREYANNLNQNILFELDKGDQPSWNGQTNHKMVEYMKGQLSVTREVIHFLQGEYDHLFDNSLPIDYILGYPIKK